MTNKTTNKPPFKVKCIYIDNDCLTVGEEYVVIEVDDGFYKVRNDCGITWWYYDNRFEIVETPPKDKQEFSVGDNVVVNKISDYFVSCADNNVKVGDIATVTWIENHGGYDVRLTNPNWRNSWRFSKADVSLAVDDNLLSPQEVVQATLDGKELEIQYTDGTWDSMLHLTKGKSYSVWGGYDGGNILVIDDSNMVVPYPLSYFEPICGVHTKSETAENDTKVGVNTTFKVGDKVYVGLTGRVAKVTEIIEDEVVSVANKNNSRRVWTTNICHATQENYEMLSKLYPHIEIELPHKEITGSNLCKATLKK